MVSIVVVVSVAPAFAAGDAYNPLSTPVGQGKILQYIVEDGSVERNSYVALMPPAVTSASEVRAGKWRWCATLQDEDCKPSNNPINMKATSILGPCESAIQENCLESVAFGREGSLENATLIKVSDGLSFKASPEVNFPGGSSISLWRAPNAPSASGTTTYAVMPRLQLYFRNGKFFVGDLFTDIIPYRDVRGNFSSIKINNRADATPETKYDFAPHAQTCVYEEDGVCGVAQDFAEGIRARLKIRLTKEVGGWFRGRLKDQSIEVSNFSASNNLITIEASPVTVPRMAYVIDSSTMDDQQKIWFQNMGRWTTNDGGAASGAQGGWPKDAFPFLAYYRTKVNDTSTNTNTFWNFSTTSWGSGSKCLQDTSKVLGIVSTNAMAYDGAAPSFENGALNYHVSGLHYMPDGKSPVLGTYNLVLRSETARCLYNFTNAPVSATISISGENGTTIATATTSERNGWIYLSAYGFTFSEKTIQVKLTQEVQNLLPTKTDKPTTVTPMKKVSITCQKNKVRKIITASNPKCPSGYKKVN